MSSVPKRPSFAFNECATNRSPIPERGLTFVIRTDAAFATAPLKRKILAHIRSHSDHPLHDTPYLESHVTKIAHSAYQVWGHEILHAKAECLDYPQYNLQAPEDESLHIHFYNADALTKKAIERAEQFIASQPDYDPQIPVMFISLDDMIHKQREPWADIGFSRLFDHDGKNHFGYIGRPGMRPLSDQIADAKQQIDALAQQYGRKIPVVLLEDNVRYAKMLNWVFGMLDQQDFFANADLAAISTCFCCASQEERAAIKHGGKTIPLTVAIDYEKNLVDVCTPRDLMLDGFVVEVNGNVTRLPGIFADVIERFKIKPEKSGQFRQHVLQANIDFCRTLGDAFRIPLPVSWFKGADAISHVHNVA